MPLRPILPNNHHNRTSDADRAGADGTYRSPGPTRHRPVSAMFTNRRTIKDRAGRQTCQPRRPAHAGSRRSRPALVPCRANPQQRATPRFQGATKPSPLAGEGGERSEPGEGASQYSAAPTVCPALCCCGPCCGPVSRPGHGPDRRSPLLWPGLPTGPRPRPKVSWRSWSLSGSISLRPSLVPVAQSEDPATTESPRAWHRSSRGRPTHRPARRSLALVRSQAEPGNEACGRQTGVCLLLSVLLFFL